MDLIYAFDNFTSFFFFFHSIKKWTIELIYLDKVKSGRVKFRDFEWMDSKMK